MRETMYIIIPKVNGVLTPPSTPVVHHTYPDATEAARSLASDNPDREFYVFAAIYRARASVTIESEEI